MSILRPALLFGLSAGAHGFSSTPTTSTVPMETDHYVAATVENVRWGEYCAAAHSARMLASQSQPWPRSPAQACKAKALRCRPALRSNSPTALARARLHG